MIYAVIALVSAAVGAVVGYKYGAKELALFAEDVRALERDIERAAVSATMTGKADLKAVLRRIRDVRKKF